MGILQQSRLKGILYWLFGFYVGRAIDEFIVQLSLINSLKPLKIYYDCNYFIE